MTAIDEIEYKMWRERKLWDLAQNKYWELVRYTLLHILEQSEDVLKEAEQLRDLLQLRPIQEQILFYHAEPLDVAIDLSDKKSNQIDNNHIQHYLDVTKKFGWNSKIFALELI
jgi:Fic family protein